MSLNLKQNRFQNSINNNFVHQKEQDNFSFYWNKQVLKTKKINQFACFDNGIFLSNDNFLFKKSLLNSQLKSIKLPSNIKVKKLKTTKQGQYCFLLTTNSQLYFFDANLKYYLIANSVLNFKFSASYLYFLTTNYKLFSKNLKTNKTKQLLKTLIFKNIYFKNNFLFASSFSNQLFLIKNQKYLIFKNKKETLAVISFKILFVNNNLNVYIQDQFNNLYCFTINNLKISSIALLSANVTLYDLSQNYLVFDNLGKTINILNFITKAKFSFQIKNIPAKIIANNNSLFFLSVNNYLFGINLKTNKENLIFQGDIKTINSNKKLNFLYFNTNNSIGFYKNNILSTHKYLFEINKLVFLKKNASLFFLNQANQIFVLNFKILDFLNLNNNEVFNNSIHYYLKNQVFDFGLDSQFLNKIYLNNKIVNLKSFQINNTNVINSLKIVVNKDFLSVLSCFFDLDKNQIDYNQGCITLKVEIIASQNFNIFQNQSNCFFQDLGENINNYNLGQVHILNSLASFCEVINLSNVPILDQQNSKLYLGTLKNSVFIASKIFSLNKTSNQFLITKKGLYKLVIINKFKQSKIYYISVDAPLNFNYAINNNFKNKSTLLKLKYNFLLSSLNSAQKNSLCLSVNKYQFKIIKYGLNWISQNQKNVKFQNLNCWNFLTNLFLANISQFVLPKTINKDLKFDFSFLNQKITFQLNNYINLILHKIDKNTFQKDLKLLNLEKLNLNNFTYSIKNANQILADSTNYQKYIKQNATILINKVFLKYKLSKQVIQKGTSLFENNLFNYCQKTTWSTNFKNTFAKSYNFALLNSDVTKFALKNEPKKNNSNTTNVYLILIIVGVLIILLLIIFAYRYRHKIKYILKGKKYD